MRKKWKWTLGSVAIILIAALSLAGWKVYGTYNELDDMSKDPDESRFGGFVEVPEQKPPEWEGTERVNVLLMGGDDRGLREGEVARSDTMMVVSFDPPTKQVHLFSILRDTYVDIPDHRKNRINTAITLGGPNLAMKTVGDLLGLDIQYYVYADFQGFIKLVDAVGGIDFYVEKNMRWTDSADGHRYDIDLKKGQQHLDGEKALQYVRFRHDAMSDFTRTERQREFMGAVADKLKSGWNLIRLPEILNQINPYMETNMSVNDMLKLASLGYKSHQAGSAQVPPMDLLADVDAGGSAVLGIKDEDELRAYVQEVLAKDETAAEPSGSPSASGATGSGSGGTGSSGTSSTSGGQ